nr:uncharacterized protein LOC128692366 [Cherax quadricarinatus]
MSAADSFDNVLSALGFGRWQIPSLLVTILALSQFSVHLIGSPLLSAPLPFRCSMTQPNLSSNSSWTEDASSLDFDEECLSFPTISTTSTFTNTTSTSTSTTSTSTNLTIANTSNITSQLLTSSDAASSTIRIITTTSASADIIDTSSVGPSSTPVNLTTIWHTTGLPSCPIVQYDTSVFTSTVISEWDLVCERSVLRPLFQTLFTVGGMLGSTIGGHLGDRFGRRRAVLAACVVNLLVVVSMTLATFFPLLITLRFLTGCSVMAMVVPAWSLSKKLLQVLVFMNKKTFLWLLTPEGLFPLGVVRSAFLDVTNIPQLTPRAMFTAR